MAQVINETQEKQTSCTCTAEDLQNNSIRYSIQSLSIESQPTWDPMSNWAAKNNNNKIRLLVLTAICLFAWGGQKQTENIERR